MKQTKLETYMLSGLYLPYTLEQQWLLEPADYYERERGINLFAKWNKLGLRTGWYGSLHVGPENPVTNRRQYGLVPYFAGYTANCNYAHHLGPYNDDSVTYRPMVFAYGTGDGVLDTIQWEGFREGVDDIRYATALVKLAREAAKSPKTELRYAGNKALLGRYADARLHPRPA